MHIRVQTFGSWDIDLEAEPSYRVHDIISGVKEVLKGEGQPEVPLHLILLFEGVKLHPGRTLEYWHIQEGSVLQAVYQICPPQDRSPFTIQVKCLTGKTIKLEIKHTDYIWDLKRQIQDQERIPSDQQRLIFNSRQMGDDQQVLEWDLREGDMIHLVLRLGGGPFVKIRVTTLAGNKYNFEFRFNIDVSTIKQQIRERTGVEVRSFIVEGDIIFGETLSKDIALRYGRESGVTLNMRMVRYSSLVGPYVASLEGEAAPYWR